MKLPKYCISNKRSKAVWQGVHEEIMKIRIKAAKMSVSDEIDRLLGDLCEKAPEAALKALEINKKLETKI